MKLTFKILKHGFNFYKHFCNLKLPISRKRLFAIKFKTEQHTYTIKVLNYLL